MINYKKVLCILFTIMIMISAVVPAFAEKTTENDESTTESTTITTTVEDTTAQIEEIASQSVVTGYSVSRNQGKIKKNDLVNVVVEVRNLKMLTSQCKKIDITKTADSFRNGSVSYAVKSRSNELLTYEVRFNGLKYLGTGQNLEFSVIYVGTGCEPEALSVTIDTCVPGEETTEETTVKPKSAPVISISRSAIDEEIIPGKTFTANIVLKNESDNDARGAVVVVEPGEGLSLVETKVSKSIGNIGKRRTVTIPFKFKVSDDCELSQLTLSVSVKYSYSTGSESAEGSTDERILIPIKTGQSTTKTSKTPATPNIIVTGYNYGGSSIAAGNTFNLTISFKNTSEDTAVENIVMAVSTGENLSITSASNSYYYKSLKPGETKTETIKMQIPANATATGAKADISFNYEYVSDGARSAASTNENLSIPVFLPDRFSVSEPENIYATAGEETTISIPYINRGKGSVSNVEFEVVFENKDSVFCEEPKQHLGNFEAGSSGTIDFFFTPNESGELNLTAIVKYEDEMTHEKTIEIPISLNVEEMIYEEPYYEDPGEYVEEESRFPAWLIYVIVAAAVVIVVIVVIVIVKKKKKKAKDSIPEDFDWDNTDQI